MLKLEVALAERSYPILIGGGLLSDPSAFADHVPGRDLLLVSNTTVAPLYAERVRAALPDRRIVDLRLPDGEQYKTLEYVARVLDVLVANSFGRDSVVLALGGGSVLYRGTNLTPVLGTSLGQLIHPALWRPPA